MTPRMTARRALRLSLWGVATLAVLSVSIRAQDRLRTMPGYDQYQKMGKEIVGAVKSGQLNVTWKDDGQTFEFAKDGRLYRYDVASRKMTEVDDAPAAPSGPPGGGRAGGGRAAPARGRQVMSAESPDKALRAFYRDRNVYLSGADGGNEIAVTTDGRGNPERVKYGTASWVYGEELNQSTAMWWSPDSKKLAYYRFDEKSVPDYYLQTKQTELYSEVDTEAYPKAGQPNPIVDLFVYDIAAKKSVRIDVRSGKPFDNDVVGHYVYHVAWSPDGTELLFHRMNRRQNILEVAAANPNTGTCRVVLHEEWPTGWIFLEQNPTMVFLKDGKRFIWLSERNGWRNYYLYDLGGKLIAPLTKYTTFEAGNLVKVDEDRSLIFLMARDGDNHLKLQLHRVGLDGNNDVRLTNPAFHHSVGSCMAQASGGSGLGGRGGGQTCGISPDDRYFIDVYQTRDTPPATRLVDATTGKVVTELAQSDLTRFEALGLKQAEMFTFRAADGQTTLWGLISFPSNFDPSKKYPMLVDVYGAPGFPLDPVRGDSTTAREVFVQPNPIAEYGFLVVNVESRAVAGMGKRQLDSVYLKLGQVEMDDMAKGVKALWSRPYVDKDRVGIYGTSYGGYSSLMCVLRHPEVFRVAAASSPVTAWTQYDSIYTERYMWIPEENKAGYEAGSAMTYAKNLDGRLLLYYGTADNNVHPTNMMQLIQALQKAGKSFEVQVGPDAGHSEVNQQRMMEFFIENLVINRPRADQAGLARVE
jgi:dipeptidyl-peptidase-4